jgi:eukaryotic-like serine/threonine-protein kinase
MSRAEESQRLLEIALTVADGSNVDWAARKAETPDDAGLLEGLRDIASMARQHDIDADPAPDMRDARRWGPLRLLRMLGEGSFGEVWVAWDPALDREVALKVRRAEGEDAGSRRWLEEGRRLARVHHPNVLAVFGADTHDQRAGIWSESIDGVTLEAWLDANGPMGAREAALVGLDLCAALAAVHAAGLVHGDLKPANVMRVGAASGDPRASGRIVLMDFGSAAEEGTLATMGTPLALAPEVLAGGHPTSRSDIYSLGVVLFRMVTGRWPVDATSLDGLRQAHARGERVALRAARPNLPHAFVETIERALDPDPGHRFTGAAEMERSLAAVVAPVPARAGRGARTWRGAGVVATLVLVGALAWLAWPRRGPVAEPPAEGSRIAAPGKSTAVPGVSAPGPAPAGRILPALDVHATLYRLGERVPEALDDGDRITPGDHMYLELRAAVPVHAYVLDEDDSSHVFVLFPLPGHGVSNPIAAGGMHRLPGADAGEELDWEVTSAGGRETFLLIASSEPVESVERVLRTHHAARADAPVEYPELDTSGLGVVRGVGGVAHRPAEAGAPTGELVALEEALHRAAGTRIWTRLIVLRNPVFR